jgi:DNA-binding XRE family transcriptional regulator
VKSRTAPRTKPSDLGLFLQFLRKRIDPAVPNLGPFRRLPSSLGKRVTQAELSEAIGVSREWYAVLESARHVRASTRPSAALLQRMADALALTPNERATLFQLAVPEAWAYAMTLPAPRCPRCLSVRAFALEATLRRNIR